MPSDRTTVTELGTALGMLGLADIDEALRSRPAVMRSLSPELWERLSALRAGGAFDAEFHAAWANGQAFLSARDGLRGRRPELVEWKGTGRAPGDEVAPIDLRVDHVYLVSCKYLSKILFNVSPSHVFDSLLTGGPRRAGRSEAEGTGPGGDWFAEVAPAEYQALYAAVRNAVRGGGGGDGGGGGASEERRRASGAGGRTWGGAPTLPGIGSGPPVARAGRTAPFDPGRTPVRGVPAVVLRDLPERAETLTSGQREGLGHWLRSGWPPGAKEHYGALSNAVATASAERWRTALSGAGAAEAMVWRLLRMGGTPYFVLGSSDTRSLRLRIDTSWDWRQQYRLLSLDMEPQPGGQARVGWEATVRHRASHADVSVAGHIEVRWSHGRFAGPPEAKGYLDTPHHLVPGYVTLR